MVPPMSAFDVFSSLSLFRQVTHEDLLSLIPRITLDFCTFAPGERIMDEESEPLGLVYLLEGRVLGRHGDSRLYFGPGDLLTFAGLYGRDKRAYIGLEAIEKTRVLVVDAKSLLFLMQQHSAIMATYLGWLSDAADPVRCLHTLSERQHHVDDRP